MELSSVVNYIFYGRFTPLTEKIQYVAAFLLQIQSSASQQISFLSAAMLLWHSSGLLPSFAVLPLMNRSMCKYLKTLNNIIATWMHVQKNKQKKRTKKPLKNNNKTPTQNNTEQDQFQNCYTYIMYLMQIYKTKERRERGSTQQPFPELTHRPYRSSFPLSHSGSLCLPVPLRHIPPQTEHAMPASTRAGNVGKTSMGKERWRISTQERLHYVGFLLCIGAMLRCVGCVYSHRLESSLKFRDEQQVQLCCPQWLLRASSADNWAPCIFNEAGRLFHSHHHTSCWL